MLGEKCVAIPDDKWCLKVLKGPVCEICLD